MSKYVVVYHDRGFRDPIAFVFESDDEAYAWRSLIHDVDPYMPLLVAEVQDPKEFLQEATAHKEDEDE